MEFKFDKAPFYIHGCLTGEDLSFFYNCIGWETLQRWPLIYDWEAIEEEFKGKINFEPQKGNPNIKDVFIENNIRFHINNNPNSDNGLSAVAFFRHLRNAFAHYRIVHEDDWYYITDKNTKGTITMKGKVNTQLLFDFCYKLYALKEEMIEKQNEINSK